MSTIKAILTQQDSGRVPKKRFEEFLEALMKGVAIDYLTTSNNEDILTQSGEKIYATKVL